MIDFFLGINHLELAGAICVFLLVALPLLKLSICGVRKQIGRLSLHAKILLGFCIVDSIIVCGSKTNEPPRSAGATLTGKAAILAAENTAAGTAAFPVSDAARCRISLAAIPVRSADFPVRGDGPFGSVSPEDIVRGYRVESVFTNEMPFAAMPSNAVEYSIWYLRGGYETGGIMELWNYGIM